MAEAIAAGRQEAAAPAMSWGDSLGNIAALDTWRAAVGLAYDQELEKANRPVRGVPSGRGWPLPVGSGEP